MNGRLRIAAPFAALLLAGVFAVGTAQARDDDYMRLSARLDLLAADPVLGTRAPAQMELARATLAALKESGRSQRAHWIYMAEQRIDLARVAAEIAVLERTHVDLQREHDRLQLEMARRDAAAARAELERQRLQAQIRAEEAERLQRKAAAARVEGEQAASAARAEAVNQGPHLKSSLGGSGRSGTIGAPRAPRRRDSSAARSWRPVAATAA
jgi:hypothetical protein